MAADLTDELLKRIAESPSRCYWHEGRAMAAELIRRRQAEKAVQAQTGQAAGHPWIPHP